MHHLVLVPAGERPELTADALWLAGAVGVEEVADIIRGAFDDHERAGAAAKALGGRVEPAADDTGLDAWRDHATVHRAGPFLVRPPWLPSQSGTTDLVLDPRHSFGSGSHPSTQLALELLAAHVSPGEHVLDVGTGSGVLAIGAALIGAHVHAIDTDPGAAAAVDANAEANGVASRINYAETDARFAAGSFDLAVCNMTIDLHELVGPALAANTVAARLIVAGILVGDHEDRARIAHERTEVHDRRVSGEWAALLLG